MQITIGNFNKALSNVARSVTTQRGNVQTLFVFGAQYAAENQGNFLYVSLLVQRLAEAKGFNVGKLIAYTRATCAVAFEKAKDGKMVFKPVPESKRDGRPLVNMALINATPWYDHERAKKDATIKTVDQIVSYLEKWAGADSDAIDTNAAALCKLLLTRANAFKADAILRNIKEDEKKAA